MKQNSKLQIKAFSCLLMLFMIFCLFPSKNVKAYTVVEGKNVYDDAGLLSDSEIKQLSKQIASIEKKLGIDIYILTTNDDLGYSSDIYIDYFFKEGHVDKNIFKEDTAILLINMDYREVYLSGYGHCQDQLNSSRIHSITDKIASYLTKGQYYQACEIAVDKVAHYMTTDYFYFQVWFQLLVALGISAIIVAIMAFSRETPITTNANTYLDQNQSRLRFHHDNYIRTVVTKTKKPESGSNGGHGGGGHSSSGPSGHSHSGGGSHF